MTRLLSTVLFCFCFIAGFSQSDSTVIYLHRSGRATTSDSGYYYIVFKKADSLWSGKTYFKKGRQLYSEGFYTAPNTNTQSGLFKYYKRSGALDHTTSYKDGDQQETIWYYPDGKKKAWLSFASGGVEPEQKAWDQNGNETTGFIVYKEAIFADGKEDWKKYLSKNLKADVAQKAGLPVGTYFVLVDFVVMPDGHITNVKPISYSETCKPCVTEAIRIIRASPDWHPAIMDNEATKTHQRQKISFIVY